jgi:hypothetical protein
VPPRLARRNRDGRFRLSNVIIGLDSLIVAFLVRGLLFRADRSDAPSLLPLHRVPGSAAHPAAPRQSRWRRLRTLHPPLLNIPRGKGRST